ncbi:MAG: hypothetical protein ACREIC_01130, partial [Limisphaerales bacterium]
LEPLAREMGKAVLVLYSGRGTGRNHLLILECSHSPSTPDSTALALCSVIERLSVRGRQLWARAKRKEFNVGYDLVEGARLVQTSLRRETLNRIVALGATVAFTCYRGESNEPGRAASGSQPLSPPRNRKSAATGHGR